MVTVNLALFRLCERGVSLEKCFSEVLRLRLDWELLHYFTFLPEGIRPDDKNSGFPTLSLDCVPPFRIGFLVCEVRMELADDILVAHHAPQVRAKSLPVIFRGHHEDQQSLVPGCNIKSLPETVEILDYGPVSGSSRPKFLGHRPHRRDDVGVPTAPYRASVATSLSETLRRAAPRPR